MRASLSGSLSAVLADGEWHSFLDLYAATRDLIAPESAIRAYRKHTKRGRPRYQTPSVPLEQQIEMGRRWRIHSSLHNFSAERSGVGIAASYRLPEGKPVWRYDVGRNAKKVATARRLRDLRAAGRAGYLKTDVQEEADAEAPNAARQTA